jgi:hypothetical protein
MAMSAARLAGGAALAGLALSPLLLTLPHRDSPTSSTPAVSSPSAVVAFEPNAGRGPQSDDFYARLGSATVAVSRGGTRVTLRDGRTVTSRLIGADAGSVRPEERLRFRVNSYVGKRSAWRTGMPTFGRVRYSSVYPGIDLVYHGSGGALEYDFIAKPGSDPSTIAIDMRGAPSLRLDRDGNLVAGNLRQLRPVAYQQVGGERRRVDASFVLDGRRVRFHLGAYDRSRPLVIDPVLAFSDILTSSTTGGFNDTAYDVAVDSSGNAYVVGRTWNNGSIPPGDPGRTEGAGFVLKLAPDGTHVWITYIAKSLISDVVVANSGDPYFAGQGFDGMPTKNAADSSFGGGTSDAAIGRLNAADGTTNWVTYLGGTLFDVTGAGDVGIDVDRDGNAYVGGSTGSSTDVAPGSPYDATLGGSGDGFVAKYGPTGTKLLATYLGGSGSDSVHAVGVDPDCQSNCDVFVGGATLSNTDFPVLGNDPQHGQMNYGGGNVDGFVARIKADFTNRVWATFYGGAGTDSVDGIAVTSLSYPVVTGLRGAAGGQTTDQVFLHQYGPDMYNGYDSVFGGNGADTVHDIADGGGNNIYLIGETASSDFPVSAPVQRDIAGAGDAFLMRFNLNFTATNPVMWSTYLGGGNSEQGYGVASGLNGDVWAVGQTISNDFPLVANKQQRPALGAWVSQIAIDPVAINSGPEGTIRVHDAAFKYSTAASGVSYSCRLGPVETSFSTCAADGKSYTGLSDGTYTFEVRITDIGGKTSRPTARQFTVDTRPIALLTVAPNPALVGRPVTFDSSASTGAGQALAKFEWDLDGDGTFDRDTGATPTTTESYPSARDITVAVRVTDAVGAVATQTAQLKVNAAPPLGTQFGVTINNGAQFTRSPNVTVTANSPSTTSSMLFSNDGGFLAPTVFPRSTSVKWKLDSSGPERLPKTIYVRFLAGTIPSETFQDDIILDETPPKVQEAVVTPAGAGAAVARTSAAKRKWKLRVKAKDSNSGVARIQATSNKKKPGKLLRYKRKLTVKSAKRPAWVRARDRAGNYSKWRKAR